MTPFEQLSAASLAGVRTFEEHEMQKKTIMLSLVAALATPLVMVPVLAAAKDRGSHAGQYDRGEMREHMRGMRGERQQRGDGMQRMMGEHSMGNEFGGMGGRGFDFDAIDADGDGRVTQDELTAWRQGRVGGADANGDGLLSAEELAAHMMGGMQERADAMAAARIAARDLDGDGMLSVEEMLAAPMPEGIFDRLDTDGDGAVTREEIAGAHDGMREGRGMMRGRNARGAGPADPSADAPEETPGSDGAEEN